MAVQSHFLIHCRRPPPSTPLMSSHSRAHGLIQVSPVRNATRLCTRTARWKTGGRRRGLTVFSGLIDHTSLQTVVPLLRGGLIALPLTILISCIPSPKIIAFRQILLSLSGRGKTKECSSSKKLSHVPKHFFCHFYILGCIWTTFLLVATWMYAYQTAPPIESMEYSIWNSVFLLLLMEAQVVRRLYEYVYVFKYSPSAQMHILIYLLGLFYYIAAPLSLCCMFSSEVFEFVVKGMLQIKEFDFWGHVNPLMQLNWNVWIGAAVFSWGWIHQLRCHAILGSLRDNKRKEDDYVIPHGDWFQYVSSPHYLAEIVMYSGLVIVSGCSDVTIWSLFAFVVANLTFTAAQTHKWYLGKFNNYPKNRKAIFPFIY